MAYKVADQRIPNGVVSILHVDLGRDVVVISNDDRHSVGSRDGVHEPLVIEEYSWVLNGVLKFCQDCGSSQCFGCTSDDDVDLEVVSNVDFR